MNDLYPYSTPIILTDSIFITYGGHENNTVLAQRQGAYVIAEEAVSRDLNTFLLPTIVSGSFTPYHNRLRLAHAYVNSILSVKYYDSEGDLIETLGTDDYQLYNDEYGLLDLEAYSRWRCTHLQHPYRVDVVYNAGLQSGTSYQPNILMALTTYADIILNEMIGYGNEAPGDIGVQDFTNQEYSEKRVKLLNTVYGSSARANFVSKLLTRYRKHRYAARRGVIK